MTDDSGADLGTSFAELRERLLRERRDHRWDALVDQASGIVMARAACGSAEAVAQLAAVARRSGRPLREVAADVVAEASGTAVDDVPAPDTVRLQPEVAGLDRSADGDDLARSLVTEALAFARASAAVIGMLDDDGAIVLVGSSGFPVREIRRWRRIPPAVDTLPNRAVRSGHPVWVQDGDEDRPVFIGETGGGPHGLRVGVPVRSGRVLIGVIIVAWLPGGSGGSPGLAGSAGAAGPGGDLDDRSRREVEAVVQAAGPALLRMLGDGLHATTSPAPTGRSQPLAPTGGSQPPAPAAHPDHHDHPAHPAHPAHPVRPERPDNAAGSGALGDSAWQDVVDLLDVPAFVVTGLSAADRPHLTARNEAAGDLTVPGPADPNLAVAAPWLAAGDVLETLALVARTGTPRRHRIGDGRLGLDLISAVRVDADTGAVLVVGHRAAEPAAEVDATLERLGRFGTWTWDAAGDRVHWSAEALRIVGAPALGDPTGLGRPPYTVHPDDAEAERRFIKTLTTEGRAAEVEFRIVHYGAEPTRVRLAADAVPVPGEAEQGGRSGRQPEQRTGPDRVVGVIQDVTEWRRAEIALEVARVQLAAQRSRADSERQLASALQQAIVPGTIHDQPRYAGVQIAARYRPASTAAGVGGDWFSVFPLRDAKLLLAIGDVAGHGLPAASAMAGLHQGLRGLALAETRPGRLLTLLNELVDGMPEFTIASACCLLWDPATRRVRWGNAGHPAPIRIRGGVAHQVEDHVGPMLGADSQADYEDLDMAVDSGDVLLLYTDGLVERRRVGDDETTAYLLGQARDPEADLDRYVDRILAGARSDTDDDVCVLAVRFE